MIHLVNNKLEMNVFGIMLIKKSCIFAALKGYRCIHEGTICPLFY